MRIIVKVVCSVPEKQGQSGLKDEGLSQVRAHLHGTGHRE